MNTKVLTPEQLEILDEQIYKIIENCNADIDDFAFNLFGKIFTIDTAYVEEEEKYISYPDPEDNHIIAKRIDGYAYHSVCCYMRADSGKDIEIYYGKIFYA